MLRVARTARGEGVSGLGELQALLPKADVVILIVPATADTYHMVDAAFLARMKDSALLVNVARGQDRRHRRAGRPEPPPAGYDTAMDVTDPEPLPQGPSAVERSRAS